VRNVITLLDAFQPYARQYLGPNWSVTERDDVIDSVRRVYGPDEDFGDDDA